MASTAVAKPKVHAEVAVHLRKTVCKTSIVANDNNYALAA